MVGIGADDTLDLSVLEIALGVVFEVEHHSSAADDAPATVRERLSNVETTATRRSPNPGVRMPARRLITSISSATMKAE